MLENLTVISQELKSLAPGGQVPCVERLEARCGHALPVSGSLGSNKS